MMKYQGQGRGVSVPRETTLMNQPHRLAYINPFEEDLLRSIGGSGTPGPGNIPQFGFSDWAKDTWAEITSGGKAETATYNGAGSGSSSSSTASSGPTSAQRPSARPETITVMDSSSPSSTRNVSWNEYVDTTRSRGAAAAPKTHVAPENNQGASALSVAMNDIRARQDALAEKKGLASILSGVESRYLDKQYDMLANQGQYTPQQGLLQQALGYTVPGMVINALSSLRPDPVSYKPVYDTQGNYVGVAGYDAEGNPVSYSGDRTNDIETGSDRLDAMVRPAVEAPVVKDGEEDNSLDSTGEDLLSTDPCPEGYVLDAETNTCVIDTAAIDSGWTPGEVVIPTELPTPGSAYTQPNIGGGGNPLMPYQMGGGLAATPSPNQAGILQIAPAPMMPQQPAVPNLTMPMQPMPVQMPAMGVRR